MDEIDRLKQDRTKAKQSVTISARRLVSSVQRQGDIDILRNLMTDLEKAYCDFLDCDEQFANLAITDEFEAHRIVNNEDLQQYKETVTKTYNNAKDMYKALSHKPETPVTSQSVPQVTCTMTRDYLTHTSSPSTYSTSNMPWGLGGLTDMPSGYSAPPLTPYYYGESRLPNMPRVSSLNYGSSVLTPGFSTRQNRSNIPTSTLFDTGMSDMQPTGPHFNRDIKLKKISLPTFSGERKDWPEFKAIWKELVEHSAISKTALAHELKSSVSGEAAQRIKSVYVTRPEAYDVMWEKLELYYEDTTASVQAVLENLSKLHSVRENDFKGLVNLIDEVEASYSQLQELNQLYVLTMRDVDQITVHLPGNIKYEWIRRYQRLSTAEKIHPFTAFMEFLDLERQAVIRLASMQTEKKPEPYKTKGLRNQYSSTHQTDGKLQGKLDHRKKFYRCAFTAHRKEGIKHDTSECLEFKKQSISKRFELLKEISACFICFGDHRKDQCPNKQPCITCNKSNHHYLLCKEKEQQVVNSSTSHAKSKTQSKKISSPPTLSLYPIQRVIVPGTGKHATVFCDGGSNTTYITHAAAERFQAKKLDKFTLEVTTMGNVQKTYDTWQYEVNLQTQTGKSAKLTAFGMDRITGPVSRLDTTVLHNLFPEYDVNLLQRHSTTVDILLGCDNFGLHPKQEIDRAGDNLSIMQGQLGICIQGSHPLLKEETEVDTNFVKTIHDIYLKVENFHSVTSYTHTEFVAPTSYPTKACSTVHSVNSEEVSPVHTFTCDKDDVGNPQSCQTTFCQQKNMNIGTFIEGEQLATETTPRCGGCKCGKCPTVGHTYSFKEEQELKMIRDNLVYDNDKQCWITSYPWIVDPNELPDNYNAVYSTLLNTERTLKKDPKWAEKFQLQIQDMLDRNVARKLSADELESWTGPKFYISHLAVFNPKSNSTPVRIVFNSSQLYKGTSLNACLAKGPDCYLNNLLAILLRWREQNIALVGDIKKMFNSVYLQPLEQHCHRFLWRDLKDDRQPDIYVITRVNFGDKPAPAISSEAIYKTADKFFQDSPQAAELLKKSSYVDDLIDSFPTLKEAVQVTSEAEDMLKKGGFQIKCWQFSGETVLRTSAKEEIQQNSNCGKVQPQLKGTSDSLQILGVGWKPVEDVIVFQTTLNFSKKKRGIRTEANLTVMDIPSSLPIILTRRIVLEQVMTIYDPIGLVCPFTLLAKIYLRETWQLNLDWDDQLPNELYQKWISFFKSMFELEQIEVERCLKPEGAVGQPWLIILSDGSNQAYGFAAYVLWKLNNGDHWCQLIMAKCRIAPLNRISTPQMELNGAVLSKRARKVIEREMRFDFEGVLHLVDSETVLNMLNKTSTRFKVYEGVRIGEIQAATSGDMSSWAWISGEENIADWLTRGRTPHQLGADSEWQKGPAILYQPMSQWGLKSGLQQNVSLPGEKKISSTSTATAKVPLIDYEKYSSVERLIWIVARIRNMAKMKSFRGGNIKHITPDVLRDAESYIVRDVQSTMEEELQKINKTGKGGQYSRLNPVKGTDGIWVVGQRLQRFNAMTTDAELQKLLPTTHPVTRLLMLQAHRKGHRGRTATLAMFRQRYWTPHGDKLAMSIKRNCQLCKLRDPVLLGQEMGLLPEGRLKPGPPFNQVMVDLFGPYTVRGEVQKRVSGKAYGVLFTDLAMRAVHIEAVYGYDTSSFLMALSRFASIRGWPEIIYSDPGSQLVGAERQLKEAWEHMDRNLLIRTGAEKGLKWVFGPADAPWYQGAAESLVKSAKRAMHYAFHNQRLSVPEFLTVCTEISNLLNERPIGVTPGQDSDINVLTPNSLLLGRATAKNPGGWQPSGSTKDRFNLVQSVCDQFWKQWTQLYAPTLVVRQKWSTSQRNLKPGDVVIVADRNTLRGVYRLGMIKEVFPGSDGKVRQVSLTYKNYKAGEKCSVYSGAKDTTVTRSVQRLSLLVPVDN